MDLGGGIKLQMVLISAGEFMMGSDELGGRPGGILQECLRWRGLKAERFADEYPQHRVRITRPFYLGAYHVTRGQFRQFVDDTGYKTDAEKGEKPGPRLEPPQAEVRLQRGYSWRKAGFEQTDAHRWST